MQYMQKIPLHCLRMSEDEQQNKEPSIDVDVIDEEEEEEQVHEVEGGEAVAVATKKKGAEMINCVEFLPWNQFVSDCKNCVISVSGPPKVGKSTFCRRVATGFLQTSGQHNHYYLKQFSAERETGNINVDMVLYDNDTPQALCKCNFVLVCFSHDDRKSFELLPKYLKAAAKHTKGKIYIVGLKADKRDAGIMNDDVQPLLKQYKCEKYVSFSSIMGYGILNFFNDLEYDGKEYK